MQRTWWPEAGTSIVTGPYCGLQYSVGCNYWRQSPHMCNIKVIFNMPDNPQHRNDVTWASWRLRSATTWIFVQQLVTSDGRKNSSHCWPFCEGNPSISLTKGQQCRKRLHVITSPLIRDHKSNDHWITNAIKFLKFSETTFTNCFSWINHETIYACLQHI